MKEVIVQQQQTPWETVLVTAVPSFFAMVAAIGAAWVGKRNHEKIKSIDNAVNGTKEGAPTLRETVEVASENVKTLVARKDMDPNARARFPWTRR